MPLTCQRSGQLVRLRSHLRGHCTGLEPATKIWRQMLSPVNVL
ncbi:hypothetical protein SeF3a_221 [Salmonella phage SeF3a]|nr:hypothetical protein SeF3a_221 [Salmonella phage SeF3a]